jgi:hypothetical protein
MLDVVHASVEYYSAIKNKDGLWIHTAMWMDESPKLLAK